MIPLRTATDQLILLKLLFPFLAGIIVAQITTWTAVPFGIAAGAMLVIYLQLLYLNKLKDLQGAAIFCFLFAIGFVHLRYQTPKVVELPVEKEAKYIFEIADDFQETAKSYKVVSKALGRNDSAFADEPKVVLYFQKDDSLPNLSVGDVVVSKTKFSEIRNPGNPFEFDYQKYMHRKGIGYSAYIKAGEYAKIAHNDAFSLTYISKRIRQKFLCILQNGKLSEKEFAVTAALTLGYKNALDSEVKQAFSKSGAMHVLAVSGLHVGVLYAFLSIFFKWGGRRKWVVILKASSIIILLWGFAFITGLSPSVCRASLMFSVFAMGDAMGRKTNFFNKLAGAAFVLLLYDPMMILNVGFQLSFVAVASIVFFQPYMEKIFSTSNSELNHYVQLLNVSVVAQVGTLGLSLYYFHQFPLYFLLTNLVAVPLASLLVKASIVLYLLSPSSFLSDLVLRGIKVMVSEMISSIEFIESLPVSTLQRIWISESQLVVFYVGLALFGAWLFTRRHKMMVLFLCSVLTFFSLGLFHEWQATRKNEFVVMNLRKHSLIGYKNGANMIFWSDSAAVRKEKIDYPTSNYVMNATCSSRIPTVACCENSDWHKGFTIINDKRIFLLNNKNMRNKSSSEPLRVDWLILANNVRIEMDDLKQLFKFNKLIIDSSNSDYRAMHIEKECDSLSIPYHSVRKSGAFRVMF